MANRFTQFGWCVYVGLWRWVTSILSKGLGIPMVIECLDGSIMILDSADCYWLIADLLLISQSLLNTEDERAVATDKRSNIATESRRHAGMGRTDKRFFAHFSEHIHHWRNSWHEPSWTYVFMTCFNCGSKPSNIGNTWQHTFPPPKCIQQIRGRAFCAATHSASITTARNKSRICTDLGA